MTGTGMMHSKVIYISITTAFSSPRTPMKLDNKRMRRAHFQPPCSSKRSMLRARHGMLLDPLPKMGSGLQDAGISVVEAARQFILDRESLPRPFLSAHVVVTIFARQIPISR